MQNSRILVVEDDTELCELVAGRLRETGYEVDIAATGVEALQRVEAHVPDLVILDIMLPELDGLEVCRRLRADHPLLYIIMLTARTGEIDRVVGLEVGADDYVSKPFSLQELVARVRSALRRLRLTQEQATQPGAAEAVLAYDDLSIDPMRREVRRAGDLLHLTVREFDLLVFLARHPDRPFTRMQLLDKVWEALNQPELLAENAPLRQQLIVLRRSVKRPASPTLRLPETTTSAGASMECGISS